MVSNAWFPNYEHCPERPPVLSMLMFIALTHVTKTEGKKAATERPTVLGCGVCDVSPKCGLRFLRTPWCLLYEEGQWSQSTAQAWSRPWVTLFWGTRGKTQFWSHCTLAVFRQWLTFVNILLSVSLHKVGAGLRPSRDRSSWDSVRGFIILWRETIGVECWHHSVTPWCDHHLGL